MPFKKIKGAKGKYKYRSPSGRKWTAKQVKMYYAHGGKFPKRRRKR